MAREYEIKPERLKSALFRADKSGASLAREINVSQATIAKLTSGVSLGSKYIHEIAKALGTSPDYLTGLTDDPAIGAVVYPTQEELSAQFDLAQVAQIDLRFGMGGGAIYDGEIETTHMSFSKAWLGYLTSSPPEHLFFAFGRGDSMVPTINDGDIVLIDRAQTRPLMADEIWAITQYDHGMIKRLRPTGDGYRIMSDNHAVKDDVATDGSMSIIGRVIAIVRRV